MTLADIKACFRYLRIHPDLTGAFGFIAQKYYCLAVAMVFGSNTSAVSWEPFRRAIKGLSKKFANKPALVEKHKRFLNMVKWDIPKASEKPPIKACKCELKPGVLDSRGNQITQSAKIWVDDALMAAIGIFGIKMVLAAIIEAIFTVMGQPNEDLRQCPLAMDKWETLVVGEQQIALGLILHTRKLSVAITQDYLKDTWELIQTHWHKGRKRFTAIEALQMVGKVTRLMEGAPWVRHLISHLHSSIAFALAQNKYFCNQHHLSSKICQEKSRARIMTAL